MTRVQDIIKGVRITLNDPNAERWSDEDLLYLINEGQEDIAKQAELFKGTFVIPLEKGKDIYALPDDLIKLQRVVYDNYKLEVVSTRFMDDLGRNSSTYNYTRENQYYTNNWISNARDAWRKDTTDNDIFFVIFDYDAEKELLKAAAPTSFPWVLSLYPKSYPDDPPAYNGPIDRKAIDAMLDSPMRRELARMILEGESVVWLLLEHATSKPTP